MSAHIYLAIIAARCLDYVYTKSLSLKKTGNYLFYMKTMMGAEPATLIANYYS